VVAAGSHRAIAGARRWSCGAVHGRAGGSMLWKAAGDARIRGERGRERQREAGSAGPLVLALRRWAALQRKGKSGRKISWQLC
jgi:hypothetical protein